jgi:hypothetical protein
MTREVKIEARCNVCRTTIDAEEPPHSLVWDGKAFELDICSGCSDAHPFGKVLELAVPVKGKQPKRKPKSADLPESELPFKCRIKPCDSKGFSTTRGRNRHETVAHTDDTATWQDFIVFSDYDDEYRCVEAGAGHNYGPWKKESTARLHYDKHHGPNKKE